MTLLPFYIIEFTKFYSK